MKYNILDAEGNILNTIVSDADFVEANFDYFEECSNPDPEPAPPEPTAEEEGRQWRDSELSATDRASQTPDWPDRDNILTYRQALRDWPSTENFPDTRPELG